MLKRILMIPSIGLKSVRSDSSFQESYDMVKWAHTGGSPHFFYVVIPDWADDVPPQLPNMLYVRIPCVRDFWYTNMVGFPSEHLAELFMRRGGRFVVDFAFIAGSRSAWYVAQVLTDHRLSREMPVMTIDGFGVFERVNKNRQQEWANVASHMCTYVGAHDAAMARYNAEWMSRYIASSEIDNYLNEGFVICPSGLDMETYAKVRSEEKKTDKPSMFFGTRFNKGKNIDFIFEVFRMIYASGMDVEVHGTTGTARTKALRYLPHEDLAALTSMKFECPREDYLRTAARSHVSLSASDEETFALHGIDHIMSGTIPVFPNASWVFTVFPTDYPFLYSPLNKEEAFDIVKWILLNNEKAQAMVEPIRKWIAEEYSSKRTTLTWLKNVDALVDKKKIDYRKRKPKFQWKGKFRWPMSMELAQIACELAPNAGDSFSMQTFLNAIQKRFALMQAKHITGLAVPRNGVPSVFDLRMVLESFGFEDDCKGPEIHLTRSDDVFSPVERYPTLSRFLKGEKGVSEKKALKEIESVEAGQSYVEDDVLDVDTVADMEEGDEEDLSNGAFV